MEKSASIFSTSKFLKIFFNFLEGKKLLEICDTTFSWIFFMKKFIWINLCFCESRKKSFLCFVLRKINVEHEEIYIFVVILIDNAKGKHKLDKNEEKCVR